MGTRTWLTPAPARVAKSSSVTNVSQWATLTSKGTHNSTPVFRQKNNIRTITSMYVSESRYCAWVHSSTILSRFWPTLTYTAKRLLEYCPFDEGLSDVLCYRIFLMFNAKKKTGQVANQKLSIDYTILWKFWLTKSCFSFWNRKRGGPEDVLYLTCSKKIPKKTTGQIANIFEISSGWPKVVFLLDTESRRARNVLYLTCSKKRGVIQGSRTSQPPRFTPRTTLSPQPFVSLLHTLILCIVLKGAISLYVLQVQMWNQFVMFCKIVWLRPESSGQLDDNCRFWRGGEYLVGASLKSLQLTSSCCFP